MQDHNIDAKSIKKCECDQFKQLWHSRITNDNNVMYQLFKISHCKEMYIKILPENLKKHYSTSELVHINYLLITEKNSDVPRNESIPFVMTVY